MTGYATWSAKQLAGVHAARAYTESRRLTGDALAQRRRDNNERYPCKVKGCKRTAYKGALCRGHWDTVPQEDKVALLVALMKAQRRITAMHHRRFLRIAQAKAR